MKSQNNKEKATINWEFEIDQTKYSKYFNSCKGVFQGGGCKAIAYIGAYKRAYERGVFFSELAGTSAGSIIAALIAAGAKPETIYNIVKTTDFHSLVKGVGNANKLRSFLISLFVKDVPKTIREHISTDALNRFGLYDSKALEVFTEKCLFMVSGKKNLKFKQIVPDLNIVCSDLQSRSIKIWNKQNTPEESIAKAVAASCSIPVFFTPIDNKYVDGGILSNLPNYLFSKEPHYNRILCFRNKGDIIDHDITSIKDYGSSLIDTVVNGAIDIQQKFTQESYEVTISTGNISATDFDKIDDSIIDELVMAGSNAMDDFLDQEQSFVKNHPSDSLPILHTEEQMYSMVSYLSLEKHDEICVCCENTYWSWSLFLSVVKWIQENTKVYVFTCNAIQSKHETEEQSRLRMLKAMGCELCEVEKLPMYGFFFSDNNIWSGITYQKEDNVFNGAFFKNHILDPIISELLIKLKQENNLINHKNNTLPKIDIRQIHEDEIINMLKHEVIYESADLSYEDVELSKLYLMNPFIRALKYKQISLLFDVYGNSQIDRFGSAAFVFDNGKDSIIGPPLVEEHNGKLFVIEGNTRCTYAYRHGMRSLRMVVARKVNKPLPCNKDDISTVDQVNITDKKISGNERYEGFDYSLFRHIEKALRPYDTYML